MARPRAKELTERELEIMQVFWDHGEQTAQDVRDRLAADGRDLAYTTVATLVRILLEKQFVTQTNVERPFRYQPARSFEEVSGNLVQDLLSRVFGGSAEKLMVSLLERKRLTKKERDALRRILEETSENGTR
ncbi:MAG: BlaI/MecI/CopY family transcriptional regulator [Planctomycetaceae bacterium]|nr:BlaI/MecI/CopY family transcriptional regulator [Planctomycetaceae bacterium]